MDHEQVMDEFPMRVSEAFGWTDEEFERYTQWVDEYRQKCREEFGDRAESISTTKSEMLVDGKKFALIVLEVNLVGAVSAPTEGGRAT